MGESARFNPFHGKPGSGHGGQFTSSSGAGSGSGKTKTAPAAGHAGAAPSGDAHKGEERAKLLSKAHADLAEAATLEKQLRTLEKQHKAASAAAKKSATAAAASKKAGHIVHHHHHAAQHKHHAHHATTTAGKITELKTRIHDLRAQAAALEAKAHSVRAGGMVTNPGGTERLHQYWVHGEGAAKIAWGTPGDFQRCVDHLGKFIADPQGYCNLAHHAALGIYPATHAAEIRKATGRSAVADSKPYGDVKYADPKNGKYPVDTAEHAKAAWSYINQAKNASQYPMGGVTLSEVKGRIKAACKHFGIEISEDDSGSGRSESLAAFERSYPLKDLSVRSGGRDGSRIVTAYAAVFDTPAFVSDQDGDYYEVIDRSAFNKAIADARPQGQRKTWSIGVFYNHGRTLVGTPSEMASMPIGVPVDITTDEVGVLTETQYHRSEFAENIIEGLESGAIPGYSFSGMFRRSNPLIPRGGFRRNARNGDYLTVRRMESTLREYGPTPMPVYKEAAIVGMRAEQLLGAMASDPELARRMISMLSASTPGEPLPDPGTPQDEEPPPRSRLVHSGRSVKQEMQAARSAFLQRHRS